MTAKSLMRLSWEFETRLGWMGIVGSPAGLARVTFGHPSRRSCHIALRQLGESERLDWCSNLADRLTAYADGAVDDFLDIELDQSGRTLFQQAVTRHCRRIPLGETCSYADLARLAGKPGAARAVGSVMSTNRFPLIVPCHRVVRAGGTIGNFSAPGGVSLKQRLLDHEASMLAVAAG
jgi:methylated-DNA-[protein]-cysteine S-methyltransferase